MKLTGRKVLVSIPSMRQREIGVIIKEKQVSEDWLNIKVKFENNVGFLERTDTLDLVLVGENAKEFLAGEMGTALGGISHINLVEENSDENNFFLSVDDNAPVKLAGFISENTGEDVEPLTEDEINQIKALKIGETWSGGLGADVKRVNQLQRGDEVTSGNGLNMVIDTVNLDNNGNLISVYGTVRDENGENRGGKTLKYKDIIIIKQKVKIKVNETKFDHQFDAIDTWVFFTANYPSNFMEAFKKGSLRDHLQEKFTYAYEKYGSSAAMNRFYLELSENNRISLVEWMLKNYKK